MKSVSIFNTLLGRLLLFGMVPAMLTIIVLVVLSTLGDYKQLRSDEERILKQAAIAVATELNHRNEKWNTLASTISFSQTNGLFGVREGSSQFIRTILEDAPLLDGISVIYEPNADGKDAESLKAGTFAPGILDATGRFLPNWIRTSSGLIVRNRTGMDVMESYQRPKTEFARTGKAVNVITEPVSRDGRLVITHAFPIVVGGKYMGNVAVDRNLQQLEEISKQMKDRLGPEVFILSSQRKFLASTTDAASGASSLEMVELEKSAFAPLSSRWRAEAGAETVFESFDPVLNEPCLYAVAAVSAGDWKVILRRTKAEVLASAEAAMYRNIVIGVIAVLIVSTMMILVARSVSTRVRLAAAVADRIAHGDLTQPIADSTAKDETGQLIHAMSTMDGNLNALVGSVKQSGIRLNSTATEIAATSRQQEMASSTFGAASNQIAAAVNEISATAKDLVRTMESVSLNASQTTDLAGSGRAGLQAMESVMHDLDRATTSISDKLGAINERSQKITTVITTITKVADQTNILSINAAIEAEKAGEFGTGFLVIAREIRRLADQTASATLDIEQMVQQMQGAVSSGVMEMDRFSDQVRRGVKNVVAAGSQLTEIIDRINQSTESFKQINASMQAQSEGAEQISEAMSSLTANAQQTMQSAKEFGIASTDLQSAIATLREAVSKFKLKE